MKLRARRMIEKKRQFIGDAFVVGIDPAKAKHQAQVVDHRGLPVGPSFSFASSVTGFQRVLFKHLHRQLPGLSREELPDRVVFAVEASLSLWQNLAHFLTAAGFRVVLVSPLTTRHGRPAFSGNFSRTDPRDALVIAMSASEGKFLFYRQYDPHARAMHRLAITYGKLRKSLQQHYTRLRSQVEMLFPEFLQVLHLDTLTARHLLKHYMLPEEFLHLDLDREARLLMALSQNQHGRPTLEKLQALAEHSIGIAKEQEEVLAERLTMNAWLSLIEPLEQQTRQVEAELVRLSRQRPYHRILTSLKGISDVLAALFIAELRRVERFTHWKQIERAAGYNLHVSESGTYVGRRRISHLGNARLRWTLYCMLSETSKYVPEVRIKYLRRRLGGSKNWQKNLIACLPQLLALLLALVREERPYEPRETSLKELDRLEKELEQRTPKRPRASRTAKAAA